MEQVAERPSRDAPARLVSIADHCGGCSTCERVCPGNAIRWREHRGRALIGVEDALCSACGDCAMACPRGAIRLDPLPVPGVPCVAGVRLVAVVDLRKCDGCGSTFASAGTLRCQICRRTAA